MAGYSLHAGVGFRATDRAGLDRLCRHILRPPLAKDRLQRREAGCIRVGLERVGSDGTSAPVFSPNSSSVSSPSFAAGPGCDGPLTLRCVGVNPATLAGAGAATRRVAGRVAARPDESLTVEPRVAAGEQAKIACLRLEKRVAG